MASAAVVVSACTPLPLLASTLSAPSLRWRGGPFHFPSAFPVKSSKCVYKNQHGRNISFLLRKRRTEQRGRPSVLQKFSAARVVAAGIQEQDLAKHFVYHRALQNTNIPIQHSPKRSKNSRQSLQFGGERYETGETAVCNRESDKNSRSVVVAVGTYRVTGSSSVERTLEAARSSKNSNSLFEARSDNRGSNASDEPCQSLSNKGPGENESTAAKTRMLYADQSCHVQQAASEASHTPYRWTIRNANYLSHRKRQTLAAARDYAEDSAQQHATALRRRQVYAAAAVSAATVLVSVSGLIYVVKTWYEKPLFVIPREEE